MMMIIHRKAEVMVKIKEKQLYHRNSPKDPRNFKWVVWVSSIRILWRMLTVRRFRWKVRMIPLGRWWTKRWIKCWEVVRASINWKSGMSLVPLIRNRAIVNWEIIITRPNKRTNLIIRVSTSKRQVWDSTEQILEK